MSEKRFTYLNTTGWNKNGFLNVMNGLNEKNKKLQKENEQLKKENKHLRCTIESNSQDDYIDYLEKQNERLKERIKALEKEVQELSCGEADWLIEEML